MLFQIPATIEDLEDKKDLVQDGKDFVKNGNNQRMKNVEAVLKNPFHFFRPGAQRVHEVYEVPPLLRPGAHQLQIGCVWYISSGKIKNVLSSDSALAVDWTWNCLTGQKSLFCSCF